MSDNWWFTEVFTDNAQALYDLLFTKDFDSELLKERLESGMFSAEDINLAAYKYVEECVYLALDVCNDHLFDHLPFGKRSRV